MSHTLKYWLNSFNPLTHEHMTEWGPIGLSPQGALLWHLFFGTDATARNAALALHHGMELDHPHTMPTTPGAPGSGSYEPVDPPATLPPAAPVSRTRVSRGFRIKDYVR